MKELTPERFYDFSAVSSAAVSPNGERVAFLVDELDTEEDWRCASTQAEQLFVSVRKQGGLAAPHLPLRTHNIGDPDRAIHRLAELSSWFEEH